MRDPVGPEVRRDLRLRFTKKRPPKDASEGVAHLSTLRFLQNRGQCVEQEFIANRVSDEIVNSFAVIDFTIIQT
jgi:hypothetical protein